MSPCRLVQVLLVAVPVSFGAVAEDATFLIKEIPGLQTPKSSDAPMQGVSDGTRAFFFAMTELSGIEPWVSDGTEAGTHQVHDVVPGSRGVASSVSVDQLSGVIVDGRFVFRTAAGEIWASDTSATSAAPIDLDGERAISEVGKVGLKAIVIAVGSSSPGLWGVDPARGTAMLLHRFNLDGSSAVSFPGRPAQFTEVKGVSYFAADEDDSGVELWATDGTAEGTERVSDILPGVDSSDPIHLGRSGDLLFFVAKARLRAGLWVIEDGVLRFVVSYLPVGPPVVNAYFAAGGVFLVQNNVLTLDSTVFFSDGSPEGSETLFVPPNDRNQRLAEGVAVGDTLYVLVQDPGFSREDMWSVDSVSGESVKLNLHPGRSTGRVMDMTAWGDRLAFTAIDYSSGDQLRIWSASEGGAPRPLRGVRLDLRERPIDMLPLGDLLLYSGGDDVSGQELLKTDETGIEAGSVANIAPDIEINVPLGLIGARDRVYFGAGGAASGIWVSNGGSGETFRLEGPESYRQDFSTYTGVAQPLGVEVGDQFLFTALGSDRREQLWVTDGTRAGASLLLEADLRVSGLVGHGGLAYLINQGRNSSQVWVSDGTLGGTTPIVELHFSYSRLHPIGDRVVAYSDYGLMPSVMQAIDSEAGQVEVLKEFDARLDTEPTVPRWFQQLGNRSVFAASDRDHGDELWISDGTRNGTGLAVDINPNLVVDESTLEIVGGAGSYPHEIVSVGERVFFFADDGSHGHELWTSDATPAGTWMVRDIVPGPESPLEIDRRQHNPPYFERTFMVRAGSRVFFVLDDGLHGREVWISDGSEEGTFLLRDIVPGPRSSDPTSLSVVDDVLLFSACDDLGCEAWVSDGTTSGTTRLADVLSGPLSSSPDGFVEAGDRVLLGARQSSGGQLRGFPRAMLPAPAPTLLRPTPTARPTGPCPGDCNGDGEVGISELVRGVGIALGNQPLTLCGAVDIDGDGRVAVNELVLAVNAALRGC